jgi:homoserine dehydrogenase
MPLGKDNLKLAIAGLGNVGAGLVDLSLKQDCLRLPGRVEIAGVSARSRSAKRPVDISIYPWFDDPVEMARRCEADVFIELIGGSDGPAKSAIEAALASGKHVVTANKALIAQHGAMLAKLAEANKVQLLFEAAVAGGIPIVRTLRDSLAGVRVHSVVGILNGTCNFILTNMLARGLSYSDALAEAQRLGYAEADPTFDVSGMDSAHKAVILSAIAFGAEPDFTSARVEGIERLEAIDLMFAQKLGYRIKLVAEGRLQGSDVICDVSPRLLPLEHPLAKVDGALNAVMVDGDPVGRLTFIGAGAGAGPTASAVMGDVARLFQGGASAALGQPVSRLGLRFAMPNTLDETSLFYLRVRLADRSGTLARLSDALAQDGVSIDKLIQDSGGETGAAPVVLVTHRCPESAVRNAVARLEGSDTVVDAPQVIRIEDL